MGLFSKKGNCSICGTENADKQIKDGFVCRKCIAESGILSLNWKEVSSERIKRCIKATAEDNERLKTFSADRKVDKYFLVDLQHHLWKLPKIEIAFPFEYLVGYEVIENGHVLNEEGMFGKVISQKVIKELRVKLITKHERFPEVHINLLVNGNIKSNSMLYSIHQGTLQRILTELTLIKNENDQKEVQNRMSEESEIDEILKFKNLLDQGIITQEEFEFKKKQILGM